MRKSLVVKYESLGTQSKHLGYDEMGKEDLAEIRARRTSTFNISILTAFIISTTQASVETKLGKLI